MQDIAQDLAITGQYRIFRHNMLLDPLADALTVGSRLTQPIADHGQRRHGLRCQHASHIHAEIEKHGKTEHEDLCVAQPPRGKEVSPAGKRSPASSSPTGINGKNIRRPMSMTV